MQAVLVKQFGEIDEVVQLHSERPRPNLDDRKRRNSSLMIVRVLACAVNPADLHLVHGRVSLVMKPKKYPFGIGMDICGRVEETAENCGGFAKGDLVMTELQPFSGGLAEYAIVDAKVAVKAPSSLTPVQAAALPMTGQTALEGLKGLKIGPDSKAIVLGGSGGIGTLLVQMLKHRGVAFIAATSTNEELVKSLGADLVIDYRKEKWWERLEGENLNFVLDTVGTTDWKVCRGAMAPGNFSRRSVFVSFVGDNPVPVIKTVGQLLSFAALVLGRALRTALWPFGAGWKMASEEPSLKGLTELAQLAENGHIKPVLDPESPFKFTLEGVKAALHKQNSHHAKGKVVVEVALANGEGEN